MVHDIEIVSGEFNVVGVCNSGNYACICITKLYSLFLLVVSYELKNVKKSYFFNSEGFW